MPDVLDDLKSKAEQDKVEFFFAMFVDMHGKPCAKLVPAEALDVLLSGGAGFAGFAAGAMGQSPADPDLIAVPDPASYTLAPWQPGLAVLQCDIHVDGAPWPYTPRVILKQVLEIANGRGFRSPGRAARPSTSLSGVLPTANWWWPTPSTSSSPRAMTPRLLRVCTTT